MDFIKTIRERAKTSLKTIVLPEGADERVIKASAVITKQKIARIIILGSLEKLNSKLKDIDKTEVEIIDPELSPKVQEYAGLLHELRKHKGMTLGKAKELAKNPIWYGTLMVKNKDVDGMVAGATTVTGDVFRPAFQIVRTAPGVGVVSSAFMMIIPNCEFGFNGHILFADCAINPNPNAKQLAEIALSTAKTWEALTDTEPKVAMLSFSTKGSAKNEMVDKVIEATEILKQHTPNFLADGELQADAALVPGVATSKAPGSPVAGQANVLIFPDINSGNIGYKLVERLAKAEAIGPISQGLAAPINDLSRGCSVEDIVNVVAITSLQAN